MVLQINGNTYGYDPITGGMQLISGQNNAPSSINGLPPPNLSINIQQQIMQMFNQMFNSFQNIQPVQPQEDILVTCDKNDLENLMLLRKSNSINLFIQFLIVSRLKFLDFSLSSTSFFDLSL